MTIEGFPTRYSKTVTTVDEGEFTVAPKPISYGQAGHIAPSTWSLTTTKTIRATADEKDDVVENVSYKLNLVGKKLIGVDRWNTFNASFSYPYAGKVADYDYGYGYAGLISDAPKDLIVFISEITGVNLIPYLSPVLNVKRVAG